MLCLNIRSTYPRIGLHTQLASLDSHMRPAQLSREYRAPRADVGVTQVRIDIDSYPSRHVYGNTSHGDFAAEYGQQGIQDVQEGNSSHTENAWDNIENGAVPGGPTRQVAQAESRVDNQISQQRYLAAEHIPAPTITVTPSSVQGDIDTGKDEVTAQTYAFADVAFNPGKVDVYLQQQGNVRMWTTEGQYDIYA